jgi:RNA 2',3'-cyclic 3'-phosphodiesterase
MAAKAVCLVKTTGALQKGPASDEAFAMRLFVALEIPETVREKLAAIRSKFPKPESQMRWVRAGNFHVTLKFIGEVPEEKIRHITEALRTIQRDSPMQLYFRGLGWYWNAKGFGMLFGKIENGDSFAALAGQVDRCLLPLGIPPQDREYLPHLTLARCTSLQQQSRSRVPADILAVTKEVGGFEFGAVRAQEFHLIESKLRPGGSKYLTLASFPFAQAANA